MSLVLGTATEEGAALDWVRLLSEEVGPRRPTGPAERRAAELVADRLARSGLTVEQRPFSGYATFALPYGAALGVALLGVAFARRRPWLASALAAAGATLTAAEDGMVHRPLTRLLARRPSRNVVATIEPSGEPERTVCLLCHLDSSRSGLIFHRRFLPLLQPWIALHSASFAITVAGPLLRRARLGRKVLAAAYAILIANLGLLAERELRGVDVPGANDNASGVAAVGTLAAELNGRPLSSTRVVCLFTGCEEALVLGAQAFLKDLGPASQPLPNDLGSPQSRERGAQELRSWVFLNFDGVAAPATLRYLRREGAARKWPADAHLVRIASEIAQRHPELGLEGTDHNAGLTYDSTPVMAHGGRAITFSTQDRIIPNYHSPTDRVENTDPSALERAIEVGRLMLAAIDRGEAD